MNVTYQTANDTTKVEDNPENGNIPALLRFRGIGHHDHALRSPEHTSAASEQEASEDDIADVLGMLEAQVAADVDGVPDASKAHGDINAKSVGQGTGEEADHGESGVECGVGVVGGFGAEQTATAQSVQSVEHALRRCQRRITRHVRLVFLTGAEEADECHHDNLDLRTRVPWQLLAADFEPAIQPSVWQRSALDDMLFRGVVALGGRCFLVGHGGRRRMIVCVPS